MFCQIFKFSFSLVVRCFQRAHRNPSSIHNLWIFIPYFFRSQKSGCHQKFWWGADPLLIGASEAAHFWCPDQKWVGAPSDEACLWRRRQKSRTLFWWGVNPLLTPHQMRRLPLTPPSEESNPLLMAASEERLPLTQPSEEGWRRIPSSDFWKNLEKYFKVENRTRVSMRCVNIPDH